MADLSAAGDKLVLSPAVPIEVLEFGFLLTAAVDDTAGDGMVAKLDKRPTAGSETGRGDGDAGVMTLTQAQADALEAGEVARSRPDSPALIYPGEEAVLQLTDAVAVSGTGIPFIVYREAHKSDRTTETVVSA